MSIELPAGEADTPTAVFREIEQKMLDWQEECRQRGVYDARDPDQLMAAWVLTQARRALAIAADPIAAKALRIGEAWQEVRAALPDWWVGPNVRWLHNDEPDEGGEPNGQVEVSAYSPGDHLVVRHHDIEDALRVLAQELAARRSTPRVAS